MYCTALTWYIRLSAIRFSLLVPLHQHGEHTCALPDVSNGNANRTGRLQHWLTGGDAMKSHSRQQWLITCAHGSGPTSVTYTQPLHPWPSPVKYDPCLWPSPPKNLKIWKISYPFSVLFRRRKLIGPVKNVSFEHTAQEALYLHLCFIHSSLPATTSPIPDVSHSVCAIGFLFPIYLPIPAPWFPASTTQPDAGPGHGDDGWALGRCRHPPHSVAVCYLITECRTQRDAPLGTRPPLAHTG